MKPNQKTRIRVFLTMFFVVLATSVGVTSARADPSPNCPDQNLCLYSGTYYDGQQLNFYRCEFVDIGRIWGNDRIRSIINNQDGGTRSNFYNWYASSASWQFVGFSVAKANYSTVSAAVRSSEGVRVC